MNTEHKQNLEEFDRYKIDHPFLSTAFNKTLAAVRGASTGSSVIIVTGPTGAGKTTLATRLYRVLRDELQQDGSQDELPVLYGNAVSPHASSFGWKDFYTRLLTRSAEPLVSKKLFVDPQQDFFHTLDTGKFREGATVDALRISAESCMRKRRVRVLIIDEAHHILMVKDQRQLEYQFEAIKSLAAQTNTIIVLVGTYSLLKIRSQSGQLVRRSEIVHLPRYNCLIESDRAKFNTVLSQFLAKLPIRHTLNLNDDSLHFYAKCAGEVGILKDWLSKALDRYYQHGAKTFDREFLDQFALDNKALCTIIGEALEGERILQDISESELLKFLGTPPTQTMTENASVPKKSKKKAFQRNPERDPVGI